MYTFVYTCTFVYLNKNWKIYWSKQSFTGLGPEDWCSSWVLVSSNLIPFNHESTV